MGRVYSYLHQYMGGCLELITVELYSEWPLTLKIWTFTKAQGKHIELQNH